MWEKETRQERPQGIEKQIVVYSYNGLLLGNKKEGITDTQKAKGESQRP